jgi:hypothetical protein
VSTLVTAVSTAVAGVLAAQTQQIEQQGKFLGTLQDLNAKSAAKMLGSKGGTTTARRKKEARKAAAAQQECVLCSNPLNQNTTLEQIQFHRQHQQVQQLPTSAAAAAADEQGN